MSEHPPEQVLVIPAALANSIAPLNYGSVQPGIEKTILDNHSFREREEAELNFDFKQVIPYIVVTHTPMVPWEGEKGPYTSGTINYLLSQRTTKQQEKRLHNKYSLGQGGHINHLDFNRRRSPILEGLLREVREEFTLKQPQECVPIGIINDNSSDVSKVHLGLVYLMRVSSPEFKVAEEGKHIAQWVPADGLRAYYDSMENWSKILMDHVIHPA